VIKTKPAPAAFAYLSIGSFNHLAKKSIVANTAKPANTPVKQSHVTTIHI
jgi:hypothetical protein